MNKKTEEALNENFEYCNELNNRINIIAKAVLKLGDRIVALEELLKPKRGKCNEESNDSGSNVNDKRNNASRRTH